MTQRGLVCPAEKLISTLWPAARPRAAAKVLQVYVSRLRRRLPRGARITYRSDGYILEIHPEMLDALEFEQLVQEGRRAAEAGDAEGSRTQLKRALSLWSGQAYGEFADEDFARLDAAHLEELRLEAFEQQVDVELDLSAHAELLPELIALAAAHPLRERLQGQLILALYRCGRQAEALETYATMRVRLQDDLGLEPGPELRALQRRILSHDPDLRAAPRGALSITRRLPLPAAPLLGRVRERRELCALLSHDDVRLLVLTGPAGAGKTRLALAVAGEVAQLFSGGAAFVDLAAIHDPGLVMDAIADALGVVGRSTRDIVSRLNERELLLLIDNAEHVRAAGPTLVGLLARVPSLRILVTSRVVLHVSGEHVYPVGPLDEQTAVELFRARARARNPRFELSTANDADTIARICERLDRLPLAIELAATRTRALSPRQLLARLDPSLPLLANGLRDLPARQQTLRAALDWSHDLLADGDRDALMRLSVFVGGWTLDAAETVATVTTDALEALVDHNFVSLDVGSAEPRYTQLLTVRDYAAGKLDAAGETATTRDQHARYYRQLVGSAGISSDRPGPQRFELVNPELANVRAAIGWAMESGDAELAGELIVALEGVWIPNRPTEGLRHLDAIRADDERLPMELRARLLRVKGGCLYFHGDLEGGENATVAASDLHRELGDDLGVAILQHRLGVLAVVRGEHQKARRMILESLEACRALGFRKGEAAAHEALGLIARAEGDLDTAATLLAQSAALSAAEHLPWMEAGALESLAELELDRARPREAGEFAQRALRLNVAIESRAGILHSLGYLAAALVRSGNPTRATVLWHAIEADEAVNGRTFSEEDRESLAVDGVAFESRARVGDPEHAKPWALARAIEEALAMDFEDPSG